MQIFLNGHLDRGHQTLCWFYIIALTISVQKIHCSLLPYKSVYILLDYVQSTYHLHIHSGENSSSFFSFLNFPSFDRNLMNIFFCLFSFYFLVPSHGMGETQQDKTAKKITLIPLHLLLSLPVLFKHTIHPLANSSIHGIFTIINVDVGQ